MSTTGDYRFSSDLYGNARFEPSVHLYDLTTATETPLASLWSGSDVMLSLIAGHDYKFTYTSGYYQTDAGFVGSGTIGLYATVPEPSSAGLAIVGLIGLVMRRKRLFHN